MEKKKQLTKKTRTTQKTTEIETKNGGLKNIISKVITIKTNNNKDINDKDDDNGDNKEDEDNEKRRR